jgi:hypothetical protein
LKPPITIKIKLVATPMITVMKLASVTAEDLLLGHRQRAVVLETAAAGSAPQRGY